MYKTRYYLILLLLCLSFNSLSSLFADDSIWETRGESPRGELTLTFLGDTMAHDVNFIIKDFSVVYDGVKDILLSDDLTFSNLEAPVDETLPYKTYPRFNIHRDYVQATIDAGIEVFPLANNHSLDQGVEGVYQTLGSLMILRDENDMKIHFSGTRGNKEQEYKPVEIRKKGWRIGFISVTQFLNGYSRTPYVYIMNYNNKDDAKTFLSFVKETAGDYDLFIISYHAGGEYKLEPEPEKVEYFRKLINAGADIVYGHHPHVLQPYEKISVQGSTKLILYSMGNFISGQRWSREPYDLEHYRSYTGDSIILRTGIVDTENGPSVQKIEPILITNHIND
jgi:poly-gamma-glutamate synthesis protein (capsule biosynthesis protein)